MVKMNISDIDISEPLSDMLAPLNNEQKEFLMNNYTIQTYKKNETIYCEGETPHHLMCLISGKVKIFKDGVGGRSQIIRMIKPREYFAYRAYFAKQDFVKISTICKVFAWLNTLHIVLILPNKIL